ncbi:MAG: DUF2784 domain-containing protein [Gammaproteobacteria bacterium]|nr:DUF2784 domain-containing protein [Gammaproteobacteria bacterium]
MLYHLLANTVLLLHALFIVFVVLGGLLVLRNPRIAWLHVPVAIYGVLVEWIGWICPLTPLENHFRSLAGEQGYSSGFIQHHLLPLIYPVNYTPRLQLVLGAIVLLTNIAIYGFIAWRIARARHARFE